jgi:RNA polymerase sigma factor (sigma-70 family)
MAIADSRSLLAFPKAPNAFESASDQDLLSRFAAGHDQAAFAELVRRHSPMLLRLCRRVLHGGQDAEDVCQAAFLVLAQQAASPRWKVSVNGWLFQVAYRLSLKARAAASRRSRHEVRVKPAAPPQPLDEVTFRELQAVLDEELSRLPEKYRSPILLCCLEGRTREEAARCLGWSIATVKDRLEQGRERLRARLGNRGLSLGTALMSAWLLGGWAQAASPGVVLPFTAEGTAAAALAITTGRAGLNDFLPPRLAALVQGATTTMIPRSVIVAAFALLILGLGVVGVVTAVQRDLSSAKAPASAAVSLPAVPVQPQPQSVPPQPALLPLDGHRGAVLALALDQSGKILATAGADKTVRLWDLATGRQLHNLEQPGEALGLAFSPDGKKLGAVIAGARDDALIVFDVETGKALWRSKPGPKGKGGASGAVAFSPDGKSVAARLGGSVIQMFDVARGGIFFALQLPGDQGPSTVAFAPDGNSLAISDGSGSVLLVDPQVGRVLAKWTGRRPATSLAFLHGKVAAADGGRALRMFDFKTDKEEATLEGPEAVNALAVAADGKWAATAGPSGIVLLWDVAAGKPERRFSAQRPVHTLVLASGGKLLATAGADGAMVWDLTRDEKPLPKDLKLTAKDLETAWADLASDEAGKAYAAVRLLRADPAQAVPFLEGQLKPKVDKPAPDKLKQLIADLDAAQFKKRDAATKELEKLGVLAEPALRAALADRPPLEIKNRLERLLKLLDSDGKPLTAAQQREVRAVRVLERIEGTQPQKLLEALAKEAPGWWVRHEAQAALKRLRPSDKTP